MSERVDVIVVGSGVAGLSAALAAAEGGASVVVVERAPRGEHGGNTRYTEAFLRMKSLDEVSDDFEDQFVKSSGYHVDPNLSRDTTREFVQQSSLTRSAGFLDPNIIGQFSGEAGSTLRWLESAGVRFDDADTPFITASTTRLAPVGGGLAIVDALTSRCEESGVRFLFRTSARDLVIDDKGAIVGLTVHDDSGARDVLAQSVVLASGGFQGSPEMLARYMPRARFARPVAIGGHYNRGEGVDMALRAGAAASGDFNLFHAEPIDPRSAAPEAAIFAFGYGILVNKQARRFVDEASGTSDATYEAVTREILEQRDGIAYAIFDAALEDVPNYQRGLRTELPPIEAATLGELAAQLGLDPPALERTVEEFNNHCTDGAFSPLELDGLTTTVGLGFRKSNWARPIDRAPFRAYPVISANVFTFGGLKVDESARVVDLDGRVMTGLYAAGEVMGIYYGRYTGSTSVLRGAVFGRLAGLDAARRCTADPQADRR